MEIILFWIMYIVVGLSLYNFFFCTYERTESIINYRKQWVETDNRYKRPLWMYLVVIIVALIPFLNLSILLGMLLEYASSDRDYYYKSFLTKKY